MINIFLCDDEAILLDRYQQIIKTYIADSVINCEITLKTKNGFDLLIFLKESQIQGGIYFLDINLGSEDLNGIDLAIGIRELDPYAQLIFISTHDELLMETIQRRINILNFIYKDDGLKRVQRAIEETIDSAIHHREQQLPKLEEPSYFEYNSGFMYEKVNLDEINFFETAHKPRYVFMHSDSSLAEFVGKIADIETQLPQFYKVHKSILVNPDKIVKIDKQAHLIEFDNGDSCDVAYRKIDELIKMIKEKNK